MKLKSVAFLITLKLLYFRKVIKRAEAEAESIRIVTEAFGNAEDARNYLVAMKYIDTLGSMVTGQDNKVVYMPYEATGVLSSLGTMKELFQKTNG